MTAAFSTECDSEVLGYIAVAPDKTSVFCDGDSCIIAGSYKLMRGYLSALPSLKFDITKARYGTVRQALALGAAYSFDQKSFERFRPLAMKDGIDVSHVSTDISAWPKRTGNIPLVRVQWKPR